MTYEGELAKADSPYFEGDFMNILLVYNPVSGKSENRESRLGRALLELGKLNALITVYQTKEKGDAYEKLKSLDMSRYDLLVVCGGDGTLHELVNATLKLGIQIPIGYIPFGSTNDYARNLGINSRNAAKNIRKMKTKKLDVGEFNGEFFNYVAAFGAFTEISYSTPQDIKNSVGYLAYLLNGIKAVPEIRPFHFRCKTDTELIEDDILIGMITNTTSVAGLKRREDDIKLDDGKLEYIFVKYPKNILEIETLLFKLAAGDFDSHYLYHGQSERFEIISDNIAWTLDGEEGGSTTNVEINTHGKAFEIITGGVV